MIESNNYLDDAAMQWITVERNTKDKLKGISVWLTSQYDYLSVIHDMWGNFPAFKISIPYGQVELSKVIFKQNELQSLDCEKSNAEYVSIEQCLVNYFISDDFPSCPIKCIPIQMEGFRYVNKSTQLTSCTKLADEICNGGPLVWEDLGAAWKRCPRPCKFTSYVQSHVESEEIARLEDNPNHVHLVLTANEIKRVETEILVYDVTDLIGAIGGSLGLFLGFSFFDLISICINNFVNFVSQYQRLKRRDTNSQVLSIA